MKYFLYTIALFIGITAYTQQMNQQINMKIDSLGNAKINVSMKMNAGQWDVWVNSLGNNPAALKREIERAMPGYFLDDFKLERDDMNRSFDLSLNAYGICEIDKKGNWSIETDQKDAQLTEITSHKYMLTSSPKEFGGQVQQQYTIEFPKNAQDIKVDKDAFGETIFKFDMNNPKKAGMFNIASIAGILLIVVGGGWAGFNATKKA